MNFDSGSGSYSGRKTAFHEIEVFIKQILAFPLEIRAVLAVFFSSRRAHSHTITHSYNLTLFTHSYVTLFARYNVSFLSTSCEINTAHYHNND